MSNKTELQSNNADLQAILNKANALPDKQMLPELNNPASASQIPTGLEAIDQNGEKIVGTGSDLGDATTSDVVSGKKFTSENGLAMVGTLDKGYKVQNVNPYFRDSAFTFTATGINLSEVVGYLFILINTSGDWPNRIVPGAAYINNTACSTSATFANGTLSISITNSGGSPEVCKGQYYGVVWGY